MVWNERLPDPAGSGVKEPRLDGPACLRLAPFLLLCALLACAACGARRDFQRATADDTIEAYEEFLEEHPKKKEYAGKARTRLEVLLYERAVDQDSFAVYTEFLQRFPYGKFTAPAESRAEELRARELGLHFYRHLPEDYPQQVSPRTLPYRILVKASQPDGEISEHLERTWYEDLLRKDLFVPLHPRQAHPVSPDMTLVLRETTVRLCRVPLKQLEAEVWAGKTKIKEYRVVANRPEGALLYEIFRDRELYDSVLGIPEQEKERTEERFLNLCRRLPLPGALAVEYELRLTGDGAERDQRLTLAYAAFLKESRLFRNLVVYPRGQLPEKPPAYRLFFRVDPETHSPSIRRQWDRPGPAHTWTSWNSKWILDDQEYFFREMTLDLLRLFPPP